MSGSQVVPDYPLQQQKPGYSCIGTATWGKGIKLSTSQPYCTSRLIRTEIPALLLLGTISSCRTARESFWYKSLSCPRLRSRLSCPFSPCDCTSIFRRREKMASTLTSAPNRLRGLVIALILGVVFLTVGASADCYTPDGNVVSLGYFSYFEWNECADSVCCKGSDACFTQGLCVRKP